MPDVREEPTAAELDGLAVLLWQASREFWQARPSHPDYGNWEELNAARQDEHRAMARAIWTALMGEALAIIGFLRLWMDGGYAALHTPQDEVDAMLARADEFLAGVAK